MVSLYPRGQRGPIRALGVRGRRGNLRRRLEPVAVGSCNSWLGREPHAASGVWTRSLATAAFGKTFQTRHRRAALVFEPLRFARGSSPQPICSGEKPVSMTPHHQFTKTVNKSNQLRKNVSDDSAFGRSERRFMAGYFIVFGRDRPASRDRHIGCWRFTKSCLVMANSQPVLAALSVRQSCIVRVLQHTLRSIQSLFSVYELLE